MLVERDQVRELSDEIKPIQKILEIEEGEFVINYNQVMSENKAFIDEIFLKLHDLSLK